MKKTPIHLSFCLLLAACSSSALDVGAAGREDGSGAGIAVASQALAAYDAPAEAFLVGLTAVPTQTLGDGDATIEPNEVWSLAIPLQNTGPVDATAVTATLSTSSSGVTLITSTSAYPTIAGQGVASNTT